MGVKEKFLDLVAQSLLDEEDRQLWKEVIPLLEEGHVQTLWENIQDRSDCLLFLTENLKSKQEAILKNDREWLSWIEKKEEEYLDQLEEKKASL